MDRPVRAQRFALMPSQLFKRTHDLTISMTPIQEMQIDARFNTYTTVQRPDAYGTKAGDESGSSQRRGRARKKATAQPSR
jgi:hypothetical protein